MALSHVQTESPMALVRAAAWHNALARTGISLPLFVVFDIGVPSGARSARWLPAIVTEHRGV